MKFTIRYRLRALVRPLKRRCSKASESSSNRSCPSKDSVAQDDRNVEESIELLPPTGILLDPVTGDARPSTAPGPIRRLRSASSVFQTRTKDDESLAVPPVPRRPRTSRALTVDFSVFTWGDALPPMPALSDPDAPTSRERAATLSKRQSCMWMRVDGAGLTSFHGGALTGLM